MNTHTVKFDSAAIIKALEQHICDECNPFDTEQAFADSLDESGDIDVCGLTFSPSRIWKEMDPTAFHCGTNDYVDGLMRDGRLTDEIQGDHYDKGEAESEKESFIDGLRSELAALEQDYEDMKTDNVSEPELASMEAIIEQKNEEIDACESHSF